MACIICPIVTRYPSIISFLIGFGESFPLHYSIRGHFSSHGVLIIMPGRNCCIPKCTVSAYAPKHGCPQFMQIPTRKDEFYVKWKKNLVGVLSKYREITPELRERIEKGNVYFCYNHFADEDLEYVGKL